MRGFHRKVGGATDWVPLVAGVLAALPLLVATVHAVDAGWTPSSDDGMIALRAFDAGAGLAAVAVLAVLVAAGRDYDDTGRLPPGLKDYRLVEATAQQVTGALAGSHGVLIDVPLEVRNSLTFQSAIAYAIRRDGLAIGVPARLAREMGRQYRPGAGAYDRVISIRNGDAPPIPGGRTIVRNHAVTVMITPVDPEAFEVARTLSGGERLVIAGEIAGEGPPVVLLHGLSATRRNVVQGSRALLKRGYRLIAYDARGHGASSPAPSYGYPDLIEDLEAVLAELEVERAAFVGSSMGAATGMAFALRHPERAAAVVQITPAYNGQARTGNVDDGAWDVMATGLETGGVDAFVDVAQPAGAGEGWKRIAREAVRQRMERHEHPLEVAKALRSMPRSTAWDGLDALRDVEVPVLIVASRDEMDHLHPLAIAEEYARRLPNAELVVEEEGKSPLAWQGVRLSNVIADFFERVGYAPS